MSFADFDTGPEGNGTESITLATESFTSYNITANSEIEVTDSGKGGTTFTATEWGRGADNPVHVLALNELQRNRAVTFLFPPVSEIKITLDVGKGGGGRNIAFSGASSLVCDRVPPVTQFDSEMGVDTLDDFNLAAYTSSVKSQASASDANAKVKVKEVKYNMKAEYTVGTSVTNGQAKTAVANANNCPETLVNVTVTGGRRLLADRRLTDVKVIATIESTDASVITAAKTTASNSIALSSALTTVTGNTVEAQVTKQPALAVKVTTEVISSTTNHVEAPSEAALQQSYAQSTGKNVTVATQNVVKGVLMLPPTGAPTAAAPASATTPQHRSSQRRSSNFTPPQRQQQPTTAASTAGPTVKEHAVSKASSGISVCALVFVLLLAVASEGTRC